MNKHVSLIYFCSLGLASNLNLKEAVSQGFGIISKTQKMVQFCDKCYYSVVKMSRVVDGFHIFSGVIISIMQDGDQCTSQRWSTCHRESWKRLRRTTSLLNGMHRSVLITVLNG